MSVNQFIMNTKSNFLRSLKKTIKYSFLLTNIKKRFVLIFIELILISCSNEKTKSFNHKNPFPIQNSKVKLKLEDYLNQNSNKEFKAFQLFFSNLN